MQAQIAQLVEQRTENPRVTGSIPVLGIIAESQLSKYVILCRCSSMVEHQPSKLDTWVRFPSPAFCMQSCKFGIFPLKYGFAALFIHRSIRVIYAVFVKVIKFFV